MILPSVNFRALAGLFLLTSIHYGTAQENPVSFAAQSRVIPAYEAYSVTPAPSTREHPRNDQGQIFVLDDERLLLAWTEYYLRSPTQVTRSRFDAGGPRDWAPCQISGKISFDRGRTWSATFRLQENPGIENVKHSNLLRLPSGEILWIYHLRNHTTDKDRSSFVVYQKRSFDNCETWTEPEEVVTPSDGLYFMGADRIFLHSSGRIIMPVHWGPWYGPGDNYQSFILYSDDSGRTWQESRTKISLPLRGAEEPAVIERSDGSLFALLRTTLGYLYQSESFDRGETWSEAVSSGLPSPSSRPCMKRIPETGDLLLLWNNTLPYAKRIDGSRNFHRPRDPLSSAISRDEGKTWESFRTVERREGWDSAYPNVTFHHGEALITFYHMPLGQGGLHDSELRLKIYPISWFYQESGFPDPPMLP